MKRLWILFGLLVLAACGSSVSDEVVAESNFVFEGKIGFVQDNSTTFFGGDAHLSTYIQPQNEIAVFLANGEIYRRTNFYGANLVVADSESVSLVLADGERFDNIVGVIADSPKIAVTQVYDDVLYHLQGGRRVLVVVFDGWGWEMHRHFAQVQPFLSTKVVDVAHTVFPPFTPVAMSSMFTGQLPNVHGVHDRATRTMAAPDIFQAATDLGFTSTRIQGGVAIVQTSQRPVLLPNLGDRYETDQSVFDAAMARINDSDLTFVHFNAIDDASHTYGPYAPEVAQSMALMDDLVRQLVAAHGGIAIITGDHGQHFLGEQDRMGDHLWVSHEDMFVPYIIIRSGE